MSTSTVPPFNSPLIVQFLRISSSQLHYESTPQGITVARIISGCRPACAHLRHTLASFTAVSTEEPHVYIILAAPPQHAQICDDKLAHENLTSKEMSWSELPLPWFDLPHTSIEGEGTFTTDGGDNRSNINGLRSNGCTNDFEIQMKTNYVLHLCVCVYFCVYNTKLILFNCSHCWPFLELMNLISWKTILIKIVKYSTNPQLEFKTISQTFV